MHHRSDVDYSVEGLRVAWTEWRQAFPDLSNEIEDLIATDERVVIWYQFSGTQVGANPGRVVVKLGEAERGKSWIRDYLHVYDEDIANVYREKIYSLGLRDRDWAVMTE